MDIEDPFQLIAYLRRHGHVAPDEDVTLRKLAGGVSNRTVLVQREVGDDFVVKQALEKLRVAVDWFSSPARIHREAEGMRVLRTLAPADAIVPVLFEDEAHHLIGMGAVPEPHVNWKQDLLGGRIDLEIVRQFGQLLGRLHRGFDATAYLAGGLLRDTHFFESLRLEPYYLYTAKQETEASAFLHDLVHDTRRQRLTLVHGDYSPKNVLVRERRMVLLDHEVIHIGDPAFDVGFAMTHFLSKAHHLPERRKDFEEAAREFWRVYEREIQQAAWRSALEARAVRHTLACLLARVAGRSPLEYLGPDERIAQLRVVVDLMGAPPSTMPDVIVDFIHRLA